MTRDTSAPTVGPAAARGGLEGRTILVTRPREVAGELCHDLEQAGARVLVLPAIETVPLADTGELDRALGRLDAFAWMVFTSASAIDPVLGRLGAPHPGRRLGAGGLRVACVGEATAAAATARGLRVDLVPGTHRAEGLVEELTRELDPGAAVLFPRALRGRDVLPEGLAARGFRVETVPAYETRPAWGSAAALCDLLGSGSLDAVTLLSGSAAGALVEMAGGALPRGLVYACLGPVTARSARELGLDPVLTAGDTTVASLVKALVIHFSRC